MKGDLVITEKDIIEFYENINSIGPARLPFIFSIITLIIRKAYLTIRCKDATQDRKGDV